MYYVRRTLVGKGELIKVKIDQLIPRLNQDGGAAGGNETGSVSNIDIGGTADSGGSTASTAPDNNTAPSNNTVADQLEVEGNVTFTPEQKSVIAKMISGRLNEVKKQYEGTEVYKEVVDMIGDIIGSKDINRISQQLKQLHAQHQARQMGMTPYGFQQYQTQLQQVQQQARDTKKALIEAEFNKLRNDPKYVDADLYRDQIIDLAVSSNNLTVQQAYWAVAGEHAAKRISQSAASDAEHRTMNHIANNQTKTVEGGDTGGQKGGPKITPEIAAAAKAVGMEPEEYVMWGGITTLEEARTARQKAKGG